MGDSVARLSWDTVRAEATSLAEAAAARRLVLRLVGSTAIRLSSTEAERLIGELRPPPKDLDFICRARDRGGLRALFAERGYAVDRDMLVAMEGARYAFQNSESGLKIDLFVDRLEFCHTIALGDRLERPGVAIPLEELLLHKLQIVAPTKGDLVDLGVLFYLHEPAAGAGFELARLIEPLAGDWGFCHTVESNLAKLVRHAEEGGYATLGEGAGARIAARVRALEAAIAAAPKSMRWKLRARIGERMQWWQDVDDREGTY